VVCDTRTYFVAKQIFCIEAWTENEQLNVYKSVYGVHKALASFILVLREYTLVIG